MSEIMPDNHYENSRLTELYDLDSPWSADREFYLELAGSAPMDILDLGCGTGLLCDAYAAKGHNVTGVDPSEAMLAVARKKPNGAAVDWVHASAQDYRSSSDKRFDLIIMTGHAFQVLLSDADIAAALKTMRHHLKPDGLVVFESRNPSVDWPAQWDYDMELQLPGGVVKESRRFRSLKDSRMTFELRYQFPDEELVSVSELRFATASEIEKLLLQSNLHVEKIIGDWDWSPFDSTGSLEMIFFANA